MGFPDPSRFRTQGRPNRWSHEALRIVALESRCGDFSRGAIAGCDQGLDVQRIPLLRQSPCLKPLLMHPKRRQGIKW